MNNFNQNYHYSQKQIDILLTQIQKEPIIMRMKINLNLSPDERKKQLEEFENSCMTEKDEKEMEKAIRRGEYKRQRMLPDGTIISIGER